MSLPSSHFMCKKLVSCIFCIWHLLCVPSQQGRSRPGFGQPGHYCAGLGLHSLLLQPVALEQMRVHNKGPAGRAGWIAVRNLPCKAARTCAQILCMHGGLSPELKALEQIKRIPRPTDVPDTGLLCDLLWADPDKEARPAHTADSRINWS